MSFHPYGLGSNLGDSLVTDMAPLYLSGEVWFVDSVTGDDSYDGRERFRPLATLAQAQTNASDGDMVVLLSTHAETLTAALSITKELVIVGEGMSDGKPTVKFTRNAAAANLLTVSGDNVQLRNIWFEEDAQACSAELIAVTGAGFVMKGCRLEADGNSDSYLLNLAPGADETATVWNTDFVSTETDPDDPPVAALNVAAGVCRIIGGAFDGGVVGWTDSIGPYAILAQDCILEGEGVVLVRGSDVGYGDNATGWFSALSGSSKAPRIDTGLAIGA